MEMSRLTWDGTADREIFSDANAYRKIFIFAVQLTPSRIGNLTRLIHTLARCVTIHTVHTILSVVSLTHDMTCPLLYNLVLPLFCFASFSSFCAFVEATALRSIILRYTGAPIATRVFFFFFPFCLFGDVVFSGYFLHHSVPFSLCMESTSYVLSFWIVIFYLVTTGWVFDISLDLCENSIKKNQILIVGVGEKQGA